MTVCIFIGPTLSAEDARGVLAADYRPPVQQGDVHRAAVRHRPRAIGIIDGFFQDVPSVWHKEILWAMAQGIHVFGSASMGALRAAELAPFGMRGVGRIFAAYRDGRLAPYEAEPFEDDDEVAVMHGPAGSGFLALSEAMVNIRCTLASAADAGIIGVATRDAIVRIGKRLFYPHRSYARLLADGPEVGLPASELESLDAWLPGGRVNQKRDDALAMLVAMREFLAGDPPPARVDYVFEASEMWQRAAMLASSGGLGPADEAAGLPAEALLDELRLEGPGYPRARRLGLLRLAALRECEHHRLSQSDEAPMGALRSGGGRLGLAAGKAGERWRAENDLSSAAVARLLDDEARLDALEARAGGAPDLCLLDHLRVTGDYARYAARARAKRRVLVDAGLDSAPVDGPTQLGLTVWYFEHHLRTAIPDDVAAYAAGLRFPDLAAFYRALLGEYVYVSRGDRLSGTTDNARTGAPGA